MRWIEPGRVHVIGSSACPGEVARCPSVEECFCRGGARDVQPYVEVPPNDYWLAGCGPAPSSGIHLDLRPEASSLVPALASRPRPVDVNEGDPVAFSCPNLNRHGLAVHDVYHTQNLMVLEGVLVKGHQHTTSRLALPGAPQLDAVVGVVPQGVEHVGDVPLICFARDLRLLSHQDGGTTATGHQRDQKGLLVLHPPQRCSGLRVLRGDQTTMHVPRQDHRRVRIRASRLGGPVRGGTRLQILPRLLTHGESALRTAGSVRGNLRPAARRS